MSQFYSVDILGWELWGGGVRAWLGSVPMVWGQLLVQQTSLVEDNLTISHLPVGQVGLFSCRGRFLKESCQVLRSKLRSNAFLESLLFHWWTLATVQIPKEHNPTLNWRVGGAIIGAIWGLAEFLEGGFLIVLGSSPGGMWGVVWERFWKLRKLPLL